MRIAIVDDVASERKKLFEKTSVQLVKHSINAQIFDYDNSEDFLEAALQEHFNLVFLDIYMNGINGVEAARRFREFDQECILIFTTTSTDHALEGFRVRAMNYLVKPYSDKDFNSMFSEITKRLPAPDRYLDIQIVGGIERVRFCEIIYAEHFQHQIYIHTINGKTIITRQTLAEFRTRLKDDERFFLCSRGVIVNLECVADFDGKDFTLTNDEKISISRGNAKTAQVVFCDFLFKRRKNDA